MTQGKLKQDKEAEKHKKQNETQQGIDILENMRKEIDKTKKELNRDLHIPKEKREREKKKRERNARTRSHPTSIATP